MSVHGPTRARIAAVDAGITEHRLRIRELEEERQPLQLELDSVAYPVLTLPNEITSEIFLYSLPDFPGPPMPVSYYYKSWKFTPSFSQPALDFPIIPLHVCRAWRALAIATPRLWTRLCLDICFISSLIDCDTLSDFVEEWFSRAGPHTLSLSVHVAYRFRWDDDLDIPLEVRRFGPILQRHASRLRSLDLSLTDEHFSLLEETVNPASFDVLEELSISVADQDDYGSHDVDLDVLFFGDAPRLARLELDELAVPAFFDLPYRHLTHLTCRKLPVVEFFDLLADAPILESLQCGLHDRHGADPNLNPNSLLSHENLKSLTFCRGTSVAILRNLRLPALRSLRLAHPVGMISEQEFTTFLSHSSDSLQQFLCVLDEGGRRREPSFDLTWLAVASRLSYKRAQRYPISSTN